MASSTTSADFFDGNELVHRLNGGDANTSFSKGLAAGFIVGVYDTVGSKYCPPSNIYTGQLYLVVRKYLDANPEQLQSPASKLVEEAVAEAFPCDKPYK
ncbi:hypothetical protein L2734_18800 [Parashewanella spongiae]|uniref:Rap1a/Tai family immunity protein n=1 Tax=Parashewanella spongiae TaxID=342950 RepID=UPI00105977A5|nr:Rap1a/Tai family immunity protein [Parashewanella spongiae]MCL1080177.1 hypothetical protein [Parashewanella spongiae]